MNWLTEFANSRIAKRIVFANYMDHLRLKREDKSVYSDVEEALQDFAQRTGLTEMQKRALRRQMFVKIALTTMDRGIDPSGPPFQSQVQEDLGLYDTDDAPASILPGVKPGSELAKQLEQTKKKKNLFKKLRESEPQQARTDVEDRAGDEAPGTGDVGGGINANFKPGLIIEAAEEEDPWTQYQEKQESPKPTYEYKGAPKSRKPRSPGGGGKTSKEKNLLKQLQRLQNQLVQLFMEPGGSIAKPKWRPDLSVQERRKKIDLQSQMNEVRGDLAEYRSDRRQKEQVKAPSNKAARNDVQFLSLLDKELGVKSEDKRNEALKKLSPEGLQDLYDRVTKQFRDKLYYRPSQGHSDEFGDYVKCMVCDKYGLTWIDKENPGRLPTWHLNREHADELLGETEVENYRGELVDAYLRKFPGAALQSRENELASFVERLVEGATNRSLIEAPYIATESEKELNYTDDVVLDDIKYQFKRFGVDPEGKTLDELAQETLDAIKKRLEEEFPGSLEDVTYGEEGPHVSMGQIGKLKNRDIPFEAFHKAFREEVGEVSNEYRGTFSTFTAPTRKMKRRWTSTEREKVRQERFKQLRREDLVNELAIELERAPTEEEIEARIAELDMVPVNISVTGGRACWNCGEPATVLVPSRRKVAVNSATCPYCGVYREVLVETKEDDPNSGWDGRYVIRDPNENSPGGVEYYVIYEDDDYIGNGPKAVDNSRYVHRLSRAEQEIRTEIVEEDAEKVGEQYTSPLAVRDRVYSEQFGNGTVAFIEGSHIWVFPDDNPHYAELENLEGEVVKIQSRLANRSGYYKVENVEIDRDMQTVEVLLRSEDGHLGTQHYNNLQVLKQQVPVANETSLSELQKVSLGENRLRRQRYLIRLARGKNMIVKVERYVQKEKTKKETPGKYKFTGGSRLERLRGRVKRSRLIQRLFNVRWSAL